MIPNAISKLLQEIKYRIPNDVLEMVFSDSFMYYKNANLDERIMAAVIRPRVMVDMNLYSGQEVVIDISDLTPEYADNQGIVLHIPKERTAGRTIVSALSVSLNPPGVQSSTGYSIGQLPATQCDSGLMRVAQKSMENELAMENPFTTDITIIGENTILIKNTVYGVYGTLRCVVGNDEYLSNINPRVFRIISDIAVEATKSYIYNTLASQTDRISLQGGYQLENLRNIVESYADADEKYRELLKTTYMKVSMMGDHEQYSRYLKNQFPNM